MEHSWVHPRDAGGAAEDCALAAGPLTLTDLTAAPRFGIKGAGSAGWFTALGVALPKVNGVVDWGGMRLVRLGREDLVLLAEGAAGALHEIRSAWEAATGPRGWNAWRDEGWAWLRLAGPALDEAMTRLCALDLRSAAFGAERVAQTRLSGVEVILFRYAQGFDILFDISLTAHLLRLIADTAMDLTPTERDQ